MKPIILIHVVFCLVFCGINNTCGQNLVPNPSFEEYTICPYNYFMLPNDWYTCSGDPDYFNACDATNSFGVPYNGFGYQFAADGNAYCGFAAISFASVPYYKEYFGCHLLTPLQIGHKYFISFKICFAELPEIACNNIGLLFSTQSYQDYQPYDNNWGIPTTNFSQINDTTIISDSQNWTTIDGKIVADSSYQYILIGNFFDPAHTDTIKYGNNFFQQQAYYYLDEVCLSEDSVTCFSNTSTKSDFGIQNGITVFPNPFNHMTTVLINYEGRLRSIRILDYTGVDVTQNVVIYDITEVNNIQFHLSKGSLTEGIYLITIFTDYQTISTKLIITN